PPQAPADQPAVSGRGAAAAGRRRAFPPGHRLGPVRPAHACQLDPRPELELLHPDGPRPEGDSSDAIPPNMPTTGWAPRFEGRVKTGFESKGRAAGRLIWDLAYTRVPRRPGPDGTSGIGASTAP